MDFNTGLLAVLGSSIFPLLRSTSTSYLVTSVSFVLLYECLLRIA